VTMRNAPTGSQSGAQAGRSRDAAASKDALLRAAQTLFGQQGFEGTTIREIGEQAGVDASLIARYFGSKADLYIAAVIAQDAERPTSEYEGLEHLADVMLARADQRGPGPVLQAIVRSDTSAEIREAALDYVSRRLVGPFTAKLSAQGVDRPELRVQIAVSALLGISLGRSLEWFDEIRSVPREELVALIVDGLDAITASGSEL
jgi:AcrR family transcriptional regulator